MEAHTHSLVSFPHPHPTLNSVWNLYDICLFKHRKVVDVSCGESHTALVVESGLVLTFGTGDNGRLGHADLRPRNKPKVVESLRGDVPVATVVCGGKFTLLLTRDGNVMSCGHGQTGALGHGDRPTRSARRSDLRTFQIIKLLRGENPFYLSAGSMHSAVLCGDGRMMTFGFGESGQLGRKLKGGGSSDVPTAVQFKGKAQHNVRLCACGGAHTILLDDDNAVWSFGRNDFGQCGSGDRRNRLFPYLIHTLLGKDVVDMAVGNMHSAVVCEDGACYVFGAGQQGQLGTIDQSKQQRTKRGRKQRRQGKGSGNTNPGNGSVGNNQHLDDHLLPVINAYLSELRVVQIACGGAHTLVTTLDHHSSTGPCSSASSSASSSSSSSASHAAPHLTIKSSTTKTNLITKMQRREMSERSGGGGRENFDQPQPEAEECNNAHRTSRMTSMPGVVNEVLSTLMSSRSSNKKRNKRKKKQRSRKRPPSHEERISVLGNKSSMVKQWFAKQKKRKQQRDLNNRTKIEIERDNFQNLIFPPYQWYKNLTLREFVQTVFNGIDQDNDGRIRIDMLSKAIQYNTDLCRMLSSRSEVAVLGRLHASQTELSSLDRIDLDHDGWLTVKELLIFAQQHQEEEREEREEKKGKKEKEEKEEKEENEPGHTTAQRLVGKGNVALLKGTEDKVVGNLTQQDLVRIRMHAETKQLQLQRLQEGQKTTTTISGTVAPSIKLKYPLPMRPPSVDRHSQRCQQRWKTLSAKKNPWKSSSPSKHGPYSQHEILSDRKRAFLSMKELFQQSYTRAMKQRRAHVFKVNSGANNNNIFL